jgi:hypothetical protein
MVLILNRKIILPALMQIGFFKFGPWASNESAQEKINDFMIA